MAVSKDVLGMNARNFLYIRRYNKPKARQIADDKLMTKEKLLRNDISTAKLFASFYNRKDILKFDWSSLPREGFVIKPARGYGGQGILPVKSWDGKKAVAVNGKEYTIKQIESMLFDILDGAYSLQYLTDKAFIDERILLDPFFKSIVPLELPDHLVVVFIRIPFMAYIRLPTNASAGQSHQTS